MNKKRRWEVNFLEDITEIQDFYEDLEVLFLERTRRDPYEYLRHLDCTLSEQFRIRAVHSLENGEFYKKKELKSVFGQDFGNFEMPGDQRGRVAYNFIDAPGNYMKLLGRRCIRKKDDDWPYTTGYLRLRRREQLDKDMELDWKAMEEEDPGDSLEDLEDCESQEKKRERWYKLEDHVVQKRERKKFSS
uniref:ESF1 homolog n=1 Tax=Caenorhabditis tropicalis TaxID=1561998 RepID=A0A1I7TVS6_9PELO